MAKKPPTPSTRALREDLDRAVSPIRDSSEESARSAEETSSETSPLTPEARHYLRRVAQLLAAQDLKGLLAEVESERAGERDAALRHSATGSLSSAGEEPRLPAEEERA